MPSSIPKLRIVLVDDHVLVRAGIKSLIEKISGLEVVGEANDGREAIHLVKEHHPNMVLMDIAMSGLNGLESTARIIKEFPEIRVIILSMHTNEEYVLQALRAGASGYLLKDAATIELELAIQAVSNDETYLSPSISKKVINNYLEKGGTTDSSLEQLTPRQREILQLIAEGKSTKEIAFLLNVSPKTVEAHRAQLMDRLDIHDIAGLIKYAVRMGLITLQS
jgi:DNA-binding NarL/FixJ family response regulator